MKPWGVALAVLCLAAGCVRLDVPAEFACQVDGDCEAGERCIASTCEPAGYCTNDSHCEGLQVCNDSARQCTPVECKFDTDCGTHERCTNNSCLRVECVFDEHCDAGYCRNDRCVECLSDSDCEPYACDNDTCTTFCPDGDFQCAPGYRCAEEECLPEDEVETCEGACKNLGEDCTAQAQCLEGFCCATPTSTTGTCRQASCNQGAVGDACASDVYCASGVCDGVNCAQAQDACLTGLDCLDDCCPTRYGNQACASSCRPLLGDYCDNDPGATLCAEGLCQLVSGTSGDGYCTRSCDEGCGYDSRGIQNVCVPFQTGVQSINGCRPRCESSTECAAIHPNLLCFVVPDSGGIGACDTSTASWAP